MNGEIRFEYASLVSSICEKLADLGIPTPIREIEAEIMVESDLLGVPSHGVIMLPGLVQAARDGRLNIIPHLQLRRDKGPICVLDCDNGPGRYVAVQAMAQAKERARRQGVGVCLAINTTHWGRAHAYAYRAARDGMIGICTTNASLTMAGWGATSPNLGNNPLAIGVPRAGDKPPIVLDMAMSQAAVGKIITYSREGRPAPPGWGLDSSGLPTDDPAAILASGRAIPMGEHKGAGLALMMELLTAALGDGPLCHELTRADPSILNAGSSKLFVALDVDAFADRDRFEQRVEDMLAYLRDTVSDQAFLYPGQRGWESRERNLDEGVPIHSEIAAQLQGIGVKLHQCLSNNS
jgi:LDH2 family malate/lactate/ureidoglycolate dehydrogenase